TAKPRSRASGYLIRDPKIICLAGNRCDSGGAVTGSGLLAAEQRAAATFEIDAGAIARRAGGLVPDRRAQSSGS
nr:hypothetical protein [Tanacetum cinerariifolium]